MDIVQIVASLEDRHGGPSVSVAALATALARQGETVTLASTGARTESNRTPEGLNLRVFPRDRSRKLSASSGLRDFLRDARPDVLHVHGLWLRPLHYAHGRAQELGRPLVISPRGMMNDWAWNHHRLRKALANHLVHPGAIAAARGWHATSNDEADEIRRRGITAPICVAPNGVRAPSEESLADARTYWKEQCPEAFNGRPTALFYSRFHRKKRVRELIHCWLQTAPPDWLLLVVGIPEDYSVAELAKLAGDHSAQSRIRVFDGRDAAAPYVAASLFLLPSHSENFGQVVAEALIHKVPALVTDTTPWAELSRRGFGWCVPWEEFPRSLAVALAEGPKALHEKGVAAGAWAAAEFSWDATAHRLRDFYASLA